VRSRRRPRDPKPQEPEPAHNFEGIGHRSEIANFGRRLRRPTTATWIVLAVFVGAFLSRAAWFYRAPFTPDASTVLWMALDAVRHPTLPDHGLVSSYHVFQPPGLVWLTMPAVALGHGHPAVVIIAFALLNAAAIALLIATVARYHGLVYGTALGAFLVVG